MTIIDVKCPSCGEVVQFEVLVKQTTGEKVDIIGAENEVARWKMLFWKYAEAGDREQAKIIVNKILEASPSDSNANEWYEFFNEFEFDRGVIKRLIGDKNIVHIPSFVKSIQYNVFSYESRLTQINVDEGNANYSSQDGVLFNKEKTVLISYPHGRLGAYTIPSSVVSIEFDAFRFCSG